MSPATSHEVADDDVNGPAAHGAARSCAMQLLGATETAAGVSSATMYKRCVCAATHTNHTQVAELPTTRWDLQTLAVPNHFLDCSRSFADPVGATVRNQVE